MSFNTWTPHAVSSESFSWSEEIWRVVEAQHIASTMKLVDHFDEQEILESLLEQSKPQVPHLARGLDYLLATPFRYNPKRGGSRFRSEIDPGVFYGAESIRTAGAELGYWRWKFLKDAVDLVSLGPVAHTIFSCKPTCQAVDLRQKPFSRDEAIWQDANQYLGTQEFARSARKTKIQSIVYQSIRDPSPSWCAAILDPAVFIGVPAKIDPHAWFMSVDSDGVRLKSQSTFYAYQYRS